MEHRIQLSVILNNAPGELSKLCEVLKAARVNILAMSIQNARDSVKELFKIRETMDRRVALAESYRSILKDSSDYSLIRLLVDQTETAEKALSKSHFPADRESVMVFRLVHQPGMLGKVAGRFGEAGINIDYVYGSAMEGAEESVFVVHVAEAELPRVRDLLEDL
jgi:hypothetical protein